MRLPTPAVTLATLGLLFLTQAHADPIDDVITAEMKRREIPGLSLAIVDGGKIIKAQGYGVTEKGGKTPVTAATLFQAGSISKPVTAVGALHLVEAGTLSLDADVNSKLTSWKLPDNEFTKEKKVTVRGILSHTAGMSVHGFPGYASDAPKPTLVQVLNGESPANTAPIRVEAAPGSAWKYSGGGYTVLQQLMIDATGKPFAEIMRETVLAPAGMRDSSYEQPLPAGNASLAATAHTSNRLPVPARWHTYPERAAAGLWTTPSDLARFAIGIQQSLAGTANPILSVAMTREILTPVKTTGLGFFIDGAGTAQRFSHGGRNEGFDSFMGASMEGGRATIIMINVNDNSGMVNRILAAISETYHWAKTTPAAAASGIEADPTPFKADAAALQHYSGRYDMGNGNMSVFAPEAGHLVSIADGLPDEAYLPIAPRRFYSANRREELAFTEDDKGNITGLVRKSNGTERKAARIGPPVRTLADRADPAPARTETLKAAIQACAKGGQTMANSPLFAARTKTDFGDRLAQGCASATAMAFLHEEDVSARTLVRHSSNVSKMLWYRVKIAGRATFLLVSLDAGGLIADLDLVDE